MATSYTGGGAGASTRGGGTGSRPPRPNGLHRRTRLTARLDPLMAPCVRIASSAYREHVGWNRHCPPSHPESVIRYSAMPARRIARAGAPARHRAPRTDIIGSSLRVRTAPSSLRSDPAFVRPGWSHEPPRRGRCLRHPGVRPPGAPLEGSAARGSVAPRRRPSSPRRGPSAPTQARRTGRLARRARGARHGTPSGSPGCARLVSRRRTAGCAPCAAARRGSPGRPAFASADGSRGSWPVVGCSAGRCAFPWPSSDPLRKGRPADRRPKREVYGNIPG